jgi:hypothetical protein
VIGPGGGVARRSQRAVWPGGWRCWVAAASRRLISGTVSGIVPGSGGGAWSGVTGAGGRGTGAVLELGGVTAQIARAAMTSTMWRRIAVYSLAWHSSKPKQSCRNLKSSSPGHLSPAALIRRVFVRS